MKSKIEIEANRGKIKKEYVVEASNGDEFLKELARLEREWVLETDTLDFASTTFTKE